MLSRVLFPDCFVVKYLLTLKTHGGHFGLQGNISLNWNRLSSDFPAAGRAAFSISPEPFGNLVFTQNLYRQRPR